jgi:nucleoside-diphosphate-sugar epimerase
VGISGKNIPIEFDTSKPEGDHSRCADFTKARSVLGWSPKVDIKDGIARLYGWIQERISGQPRTS